MAKGGIPAPSDLNADLEDAEEMTQWPEDCCQHFKAGRIRFFTLFLANRLTRTLLYVDADMAC